ncbi:MAG TPA: hypothetical protein VGX25_35365 [Actinophytocola sp.]|uniref:hypothetical protein n=1 Tax=Actinophytocola sp. TaxID=1872138 RepID=UPI002DDD8502|nr:hypothetical protein [Actinophytocola sp.]HEV2784694.1 hypothetical protein [Actinophytocola sp.]
MNLVDVAQQLADRAKTLGQLNTFPHPADAIVPDALEIELPEEIDFDGTYGRGMDSVELTVNVLVGKIGDAASARRLMAYLSGSGPRSIKQVLETGNYTAMDEVHVSRARTAGISVAGQTYLGGQFTVQVVGQGE